jgi:hypothetical protein
MVDSEGSHRGTEAQRKEGEWQNNERQNDKAMEQQTTYMACSSYDFAIHHFAISLCLCASV